MARRASTPRHSPRKDYTNAEPARRACRCVDGHSCTEKSVACLDHFWLELRELAGLPQPARPRPAQVARAA